MVERKTIQATSEAHSYIEMVKEWLIDQPAIYGFDRQASMTKALDQIILGDVLTRYEMFEEGRDENGWNHCEWSGEPISRNLRELEPGSSYVLRIDSHRGDFAYTPHLYKDAEAAYLAQIASEGVDDLQEVPGEKRLSLAALVCLAEGYEELATELLRMANRNGVET